MQSGFPTRLLHLVRCPGDRAELGTNSAEPFIDDGTVACGGCRHEYRIEGGILTLLRPDRLHPESANEMRQREAKNDSILAGTRPEWSSPLTDATEVVPTLEAVSAQHGMYVLELGCGTGRYTLALLDRSSAVVAVDFSLAGLRLLRRKLAPDAAVALVRADVTGAYAAPAAFDRVLSTLHSNLPTRDHRVAALREVAQALKADGRAIISMHHYSARDRLLREPAEGRYPDSGIYRYYMRRSEAVRESRPFFGRLRFVHLTAGVPGVKSVTLSKLAARIPLVRSALARLFLAVSENPIRRHATS